MRPGRLAVMFALALLMVACEAQVSATPPGSRSPRTERVAAEGWAMDLPVGLDERNPTQEAGGQWTMGDLLNPDWVINLRVAPRRDASVEDMVGGLLRSRGQALANGRVDAGARPLRHLVFRDRQGNPRDFLVFEAGDRVVVLDGLGVPLEQLMQMAATFEDTTP